jgi:3',5'-cyclic AMP phosphodiesterase CpdA
MKLLFQLSDPHILAPTRLAYGRVDTAALLRRAVEAVRRWRPAPEALVITGDLTDFGRADEYAHLGSLLAPVACPVYLLPGNHDDRTALRRAFATHAYLRPGPGDGDEGPVEYAVNLGGLRLLTLDTVIPGASHGALTPHQMLCLERRLQEDPGTPTLVAMHYPPFQTFIGHMDAIGLLEGSAALAEVIARHPQVERVLCGHLHRSIQRRWAGTLAMTAPSTAHQVCLDLSVHAPSAFVMEPPGMLVHARSDAGGVVTHHATFGRFDGPHPFAHEGDAADDGRGASLRDRARPFRS